MTGYCLICHRSLKDAIDLEDVRLAHGSEAMSLRACRGCGNLYVYGVRVNGRELDEETLRRSDTEIAAIFHDLWGRSIGTDGYDKQVWGRLQAMLQERGVRV